MNTVPGAYALITGASQGLGRALAEECARRRMHVLLVALPRTGLRELGAAIAARYGVECHYLEQDLTDPSGPEQVAHWVAAHGWHLRVLINNAGVSTHGLFEDTSLESNELMMNLNMAAVVRTTHLLIPTLKSHRPSYILNVASLAAMGPMPYMPVYAASKAFVFSFTLALRKELQRSGIRVSVLCPGGMPTNGDAARRIGANGWGGRLSAVRPRARRQDRARAHAARSRVHHPGLAQQDRRRREQRHAAHAVQPFGRQPVRARRAAPATQERGAAGGGARPRRFMAVKEMASWSNTAQRATRAGRARGAACSNRAPDPRDGSKHRHRPRHRRVPGRARRPPLRRRAQRPGHRRTWPAAQRGPGADGRDAGRRAWTRRWPTCAG